MTVRGGGLAVAAVFAGYAALYWPHVVGATTPLDAQLSYFAASCSVICMALGLLLATRPRSVESGFGGLDRMYRLHKHLGIAAVALVVVHFATVPGGPDEESIGPATAAEGSALAAPLTDAEAGETEEELPIDLFGLVAMIGVTALVVVTLNRKIPYHRWIASHRFMGLLFAVVGVHVLLALYDGAAIPLASPPGLALGAFLFAGLAAYVYRQVIDRRRKGHAFTVKAVNRLERATEVVLAPRDGPLAFEAGQFAFVTVDADGFREAHPFTISSGTEEDELRFTMKVLGDYTRRVRDHLVAGPDVEVEGPYGRFNPLRDPLPQAWIAGGIGITPFLSALRTMEPGHGRTVRLYYCARTAAEALFADEVEARARKLGGVTVRRFASDAGERIDADAIVDDIGGDVRRWSYWFCGPKPLVEAVSGALAARGVPSSNIHTEEFEFR